MHMYVYMTCVCVYIYASYTHLMYQMNFLMFSTIMPLSQITMIIFLFVFEPFILPFNQSSTLNFILQIKVLRSKIDCELQYFMIIYA
jgi:hypothetical protein